jgi:predicted transcriptional regulator
MAKPAEIIIAQSKGAFSIFKRQNAPKNEYNLSKVSSIRQMLSNQKARILYSIKTQKPNSIYELAKNLGRSFKAVSDDVKLLAGFGFITLKEDKNSKRRRLKPELVSDTITIQIKI